MSKYTVVQGDTFERISKKIFGTESKADIIKKSNPGATLLPGTIINVFDVNALDSFVASGLNIENPDLISVSLNGIDFPYWESVTLSRGVDSFDTIDLTAPFEFDNALFRNTFKPFSYPKIVVQVGGEFIFTGVGVSVRPDVNFDRRLITLSGYALPGVLLDCTLPASAYPAEEFNNVNVFEIAKTLCEFFGIAVKIEGDPGPPFERVAIAPEKKVFEFLTGLTKQRNLIISNTEDGALLLRRSGNTGSPVATLIENESPFISVVPQFEAQEYYSHVTGLQPSYIGIPGAQYTVENPRLKGVMRPHVFTVPDASAGDLKIAVEAKTARMFGASVRYNLEMPTWRDAKSNLWVPNTTLELQSPSAMIYSTYEFLVNSVSFFQNSENKTALLELVLPGVYSGEIPETLPWDE